MPIKEGAIDREITVDEALAELMDINRRLGNLAGDDPLRRSLESRKVELQTAARQAADRGRDPAALELELAELRSRLRGLDDRPIGKGWSEKGNYRWINDPGAYANVINRRIAEGDSPDREWVEQRIGELEAVLQDSPSDRSSENG